MYSKTLKPHGPRNAPICIITDAPEKADIVCGAFFSGQSGVKLRDWMRRAGVDVAGVRYESVSFSLTTVPGEWAGKVYRLRDRIRKCPATVFVTMGNIATFALTQQGKAPKELADAFNVAMGSLNDITKLRGGLYPLLDREERRKVIPCIHPREALKCGYKPNYEKRCRADWVFIEKEAKTLEIVKRVENYYYKGDKSTTTAIVKVMCENGPLSIDIETWTLKIDCVGFANSPTDAVVVPVTNENSKWSIPLIKYACECSTPKILQNGLYDAYWLKRTLGIDINNYKWDTLGMHHCLDPAEEHKLNFLASIYTYPRVNYWKDSFKKSLLMNSTEAWEELCRYNCKDTTNTLEIGVNALIPELIEQNMMNFYHKHYQALFAPFLSMSLRGMRVDTVLQEGYRRKLKEEAAKIRLRLSLLAGFDVYTKKGFSPIAIRELLLGVLGLRVIKKFGEETFDEGALLLMQQRETAKCGDVIGLILRHRTIKKEMDYLRMYDFDGRVRCEYTYNTDSGRASSRSNPMGSGGNLQNIKRD